MWPFLFFTWKNICWKRQPRSLWRKTIPAFVFSPPFALSLRVLLPIHFQGQIGRTCAWNNGGNGWAASPSCCGNFERMMCYTPPYLLLWWALDIAHYLLHKAEEIVEVTQIRWRGQSGGGGGEKQRIPGILNNGVKDKNVNRFFFLKLHLLAPLTVSNKLFLRL